MLVGLISCSKERGQFTAHEGQPEMLQRSSETQMATSFARRLDGKACMKKIDMKERYEDVLRKYGDINDFSTESLINLMDSKKPIIRGFSALLLGERKERSAIPKLEAALQDESVNVRENVTEALLKMGNRKGIPVLQEFVEEVSNEIEQGNHKNEVHQSDALRVLADAGEASAIPHLRRLLEHQSWVRRLKAMRALGNFYKKDTSVLTDIASMQNDEHPQVRKEAGEILERLEAKQQ